MAEKSLMRVSGRGRLRALRNVLFNLRITYDCSFLQPSASVAPTFLTPRQDSQQEQELPQETMFSPPKYVGFFPSFQLCSPFSTAPSTMTENSSQVLQRGGIPSAAISTWGWYQPAPPAVNGYFCAPQPSRPSNQRSRLKKTC